MMKRVLLHCTCSTLLVLITLQVIIASRPVLFKEDLHKEGNQAQRTRRQVTTCSTDVGLAKNTNFWQQHDPSQTFKAIEVNSNEEVVVYSENSLKSAIKWVIEYVHNVWHYINTKTTYKEGESIKGACLAVIIHEEKYLGDQHMYALNKSNPLNRTNVLDIGSLKPNLWTDKSKRSEAEDLITNQLAYFVEFSSNLKLGSPSSHIWKSPSSQDQDSAYVEIFTYDVYMNVQELNESAPRYKTEALLKSHETTFPKNNTFWFKDWFLPIYEKHGGTRVLNNYFNILANYVPVFYYEADNKNKMTLGEFVHFWSGAAREDLAPLAWNAFGWNQTLEKELGEARRKYKLKESYELTKKSYNFTIPEEKAENGDGDGDSGKKGGGEGRYNHFLQQLVCGFSLFCTLLAERVFSASISSV